MKLIRFGEAGKEKPGILDEKNIRRDLSAIFEDWNHSFFQHEGIRELMAIQQKDNFLSFPVVPDSERWGACIARPGKVICIGLNYSDHAMESGMPIPDEPIVFLKAANTVVGPYDPVFIPRNSNKTDWEIEIGIVIGKNATYLENEEDAKSHIAGYCISHDVSERAFQLERGGQWTKGKSCDTFNPTGPFLVTPHEITDPQSISMRLMVNGEQMQSGNTSRMIFSMNHIVHYLSQFMTLEAGDLISTGTPPGVGLGLKPQRFLKAGDIVELWAEGLGYQKQTLIQS
ncbi:MULTISPECIES: fumarylacetoacetate hydrolase family protein [unclassified Chitinophaga]|uniref:fumarylacetoacetate hydrolase family protein n=1 Tax=unclassified Chitinophaga TaxID=2619133 RepID=UPI00300FE535